MLLPFTWSAAPWLITWRQGLLLLVLGVFCTALAHGLFIYSLNAVRAQLAGQPRAPEDDGRYVRGKMKVARLL
ncbi:MAG: hypothetical protein P8X55_19720 [Desulfosarcinaceae bacterium]